MSAQVAPLLQEYWSAPSLFWQTTFNSLYRSARLISFSPLVFPSSAQGEKLRVSAVLKLGTINTPFTEMTSDLRVSSPEISW